MKVLRKKLKQIWIIRKIIVSYRAIRTRPSIFKKFSLLHSYFRDLKNYKKTNTGHFIIRDDDLKPCIYDNTKNTPVDVVYFYQDSWCAGKIFKNKPAHHHDIASNAHMVGIISQYVPTTMVDIRPINLQMFGLDFKKGTLISLPFEDNSIESLSSICVLEHIGLGRYGDSIDHLGSEKSAKELIRVLKTNGNLYISVPVDSENKIYFNAHRAFTRDYILFLFSELKMVEEKYIYGRDLYDSYDANNGFGTGMYHFTK